MDHAGTADAAERVALNDVMAALAAGDHGALGALITGWRPRLAAAVRRVATERHVHLGPDAVDELVVDAALAVADVARSWSPDGGAAPWTWARHQIGAALDRHLGQWADPLPDAEIDQPEQPWTPTAEPELPAVVAALASRHPEVELLQSALAHVASARDRHVFLETAVQRALGDRSAATTVGRTLGMTPEAVRQQHRRVRQRVRALAGTDPRYAPLLDLPVVA